MYKIMLGDCCAGTAQVSREGLYYRIQCRCQLSGEVMYKIMASFGETQIDLGICVPKGDKFVLEKRIPAKQIGEGHIEFSLVPRHLSVQGLFIPIRAEEPFAYLQHLENAYLEARNGQLGAVIESFTE